MEWKEVRLGNVSEIITGYPFKGNKYANEGIRVVRGDNITIGTLRWDSKEKRWNEPFNKADYYSLKENDIVIGMDGSRVGRNKAKIHKEDLPLLLAQRVACIRHNEKSDQDYLYYQIFSNNFLNYVETIKTGSAIPHISLKQIQDYPITLPTRVADQHRIASILSSLDSKIEMNITINAKLEEMAQALFRKWFVNYEPFKDKGMVESELGMIPNGWEVGKLTDIATYTNGLAMQKFQPEDIDNSYPVLKIKELGQGACDSSSDRCSKNIKEDVVVYDGDVIFSWSGTLIVDLWCGGECGLNQHLFKVTSMKYPKWFYLYWTKHHLANFIRIAKDKAVTMGHIKRGHLESALVTIPNESDMKIMNDTLTPIVENIISTRIENRNLSQLRDTLLPKLMSGEIEI